MVDFVNVTGNERKSIRKLFRKTIRRLLKDQSEFNEIPVLRT